MKFTKGLLLASSLLVTLSANVFCDKEAIDLQNKGKSKIVALSIAGGAFAATVGGSVAGWYIKKLRDENKEFENKNKSQKIRINSLKASERGLEETIQDLVDKIAGLKTKIEHNEYWNEEEVNQLHKKLDELKNKNVRLKETNHILSQYETVLKEDRDQYKKNLILLNEILNVSFNKEGVLEEATEGIDEILEILKDPRFKNYEGLHHFVEHVQKRLEEKEQEKIDKDLQKAAEIMKKKEEETKKLQDEIVNSRPSMSNKKEKKQVDFDKDLQKLENEKKEFQKGVESETFEKEEDVFYEIVREKQERYEQPLKEATMKQKRKKSNDAPKPLEIK